MSMLSSYEEEELICQHCVFSQCQKLLWKAALDHPHLLVPDQRQTTEHRAALLTRLVQVHTANTHTNKLSPLYYIIIIKLSGSLGMQCIPQRAALLKSMLNFLKKAIQDPAFSDGIRHGESTSFTDKVKIEGFTLNLSIHIKQIQIVGFINVIMQM